MTSTPATGAQTPLRLTGRAAVTLLPTAPFDFDGTMHNPSHFPSQDVAWEPGTRWQTLRWEGRAYGLRLRNRGTPAHPRVQLVVFARSTPSPAAVQSIAQEVTARFDLHSVVIPEFVRRFRRDATVGPAIRRHPGMRASSGVSLYEFLVITVMLQNTVVRRSVRMLQALFERYGRQVTFDGRTLWGFWDPQRLAAAPEGELRALRVGYRATILLRQAEPFARGALDEARLRGLPTGALRDILDGLYGVGPQSASYLLSELFHRPEPQEHLSPWEGTIMARVLFGAPRSLRTVQRVLRQRYGVWRGLAFHYLFTDLFWRHRARPIPWLTPLIRL